MRGVLRTVAVLACVLALSACGSGHHRTAFTAFSRVGRLSVPTPAGFHSRTWKGGVAISDRSGKIPIPVEAAGQGLAGYPNQAELAVYETVFQETPPALGLPLTLRNLKQLSDGLTEWGGAGAIGDRSYAVAVWLGPKAPAADRSAILGALKTIKLR